MHLLAAQAGALQQEGVAIDLGQSPGDMVFCSSADSELLMLAGAADRAGVDTLRLASTLRLSHNLSVDLWLENTVRHARLVVLRLIGGAAYWQYGVDQILALGRQRRIPVVLLPGDAVPDPVLRARSSIHPDDWTRLHALFVAGGPDNFDAILRGFGVLARSAAIPTPGPSPQGGGEGAFNRTSESGFFSGDEPSPPSPQRGGVGGGGLRPLLSTLQPQPFPRFGYWHPRAGMLDAEALAARHGARPSGEPVEPGKDLPASRPSPLRGGVGGGGRARTYLPLLFYRAALEGAGTGTIEALIAELERHGLLPVPLVVSSLKEGACIRFVQSAFRTFPPSAILNLTGFALGLDGIAPKQNPFAKTDAPVIQLVQAGRPRAQWQADKAGLTAKDLAMQVVLPELDGRIGAILVGHKQEAVFHPRTQSLLSGYEPDPDGIADAVRLALNWTRLRHAPPSERRIGIVLANYPIRDGRIANGVGYDTPQSTLEILKALEEAGYDLGAATPTPDPSPQGGGVGGGGMTYANSRHTRLEKNIRRARALRNQATPAERKLWDALRVLKADGFHFRRQVPIGRYFADFACHEHRLVVEVDGDTHFTAAGPAHDARRDAVLRSAGYRVLRFSNRDVENNVEGVFHIVTDALGGGFVSDTGLASGLPLTGNELIALLQSGPTNADPSREGGIPLPVERYLALFHTLPETLRAEVTQRWGAPETDPFFRDGAFHLPALRFGNVALLLQPGRGQHLDEARVYHDPDLVPPHAYLAAYLWLGREFCAHAVLHNGKHGTLEWLPGKALAGSRESWPHVLMGGLPHLYPFIVNDPGEGTQAKRRTGAVILDHLTPPLTRADSYGPLKHLEALLDEYYAASGLDRRRLADLRRRILDTARDAALDRDIALPPDGEEALIALDNFLCDLKQAQIRDGLHVFGCSPEGDLQRDLLVALARCPRGEGHSGDASLLRALADDLKLGFDPMDAALAAPWTGPRPDALSDLLPDPWRSTGDTLERLEELAARLVAGTPPDQAWAATAQVLEAVEAVIRPRLAASGPAEMVALLAGLDGRFIAPGPAGAPSRGRLDVLPTGRNFYSVDSRAIPTPTAWDLGRRSAELLLKRHFQAHGRYPRALALSVWGTSAMRTGGDDIAQALALIGAKPVWDSSSLRLSGYEIVPLARLGRPRIDVTLRISGFFRDAFPAQIALFDKAVRAVGALDEPEDDNPIASRMRTEALELMAGGASERDAALAAGHRIFGSKPGAYGAGLEALIEHDRWGDRLELAQAFVAAGHYAYGANADGTPERARLLARLSGLDAVVQNQDNAEHDLLDSDQYHQFGGGLVLAAEMLGGHRPAAWHMDHARPEALRARTLEEEISRVMRARVLNPKWLSGMMRHGYKGAFEMIATLDHMVAFAATTGAVRSHHFDLAFTAFVEDETVREFIRANNPFGYGELLAKFEQARRRGFWVPRSNSAHAFLEKPE